MEKGALMEKRALDFVEQEMESEPKKIRSRRSHSNLVQWLDMHKSNPYPTKVEKEQLAINSGMTIRQLNDWFANARRNIRKIGFEAWRKRKFACFDGQGLLSPHDSSSLQKTGGGIGGKGRGGRKRKLAVELKEEAITHQSPSIPPPNIICTSKMQQCYYSSNPPTLITAPFPPRTRFSEPTAGPNKPGGGLTTSYPAFHHQYPLTHYPHPPRLYHPRVELLFPPATVPQDAHHKVGYPFSSQFLSWSPSLMKSSISPGVCSSVSGDVWTPSPSFYSSPLTQQCSYGVFPQEPLN